MVFCAEIDGLELVLKHSNVGRKSGLETIYCFLCLISDPSKAKTGFTRSQLGGEGLVISEQQIFLFKTS